MRIFIIKSDIPNTLNKLLIILWYSCKLKQSYYYNLRYAPTKYYVEIKYDNVKT